MVFVTRPCFLILDCLSNLIELKGFLDDLKNIEATIGDFYFS